MARTRKQNGNAVEEKAQQKQEKQEEKAPRTWEDGRSKKELDAMGFQDNPGAQATRTTTAKVQYAPLSTFTKWVDQPRQKPRTEYAERILDDSMRANGWLPEYPAIVFPADHAEFPNQIIQANSRHDAMYRVHGKKAGAMQIPYVEHTGTVAEARLIALQDTGTGTDEKGLGDIVRAIVALMVVEGFKALGIIRYLWSNARETLHRISPTCKKCTALEGKSGEGAEKTAYGAFQTLLTLAKCPEKVREQYYQQLNDGVKKGKAITKGDLGDISKADNAKAALELFEQIMSKKEEGTDNDKPKNVVTLGQFVDMKLHLKSSLLADVASLMQKPGKDAPDSVKSRDAMEELKAVDAEIYALEQIEADKQEE